MTSVLHNTVKQRNVRSSAYKLRRIADLIRGKDVTESLALLKALPHNGASVFQKLISGAVSNLRHNNGSNSSRFCVSFVIVNEGPVGKRFQPKGRGRIYQILKRTCHVTLSVKEV